MEDNVNFDNEVLAYLSVRKDELIDSHKNYIQNHPEIREVLNDFLSSVLLHKPNDVYVFAKEYYHPFNPTPLKYKPLIVVGPSGVGKGTLINSVLSQYGGLFEKKVSYTTRPKKSYEKSIGNYHFVTKEDFMRRVEKNEFIEWCNVHGNLYGTTFADIEKIKQKGKIPIIEVDVQGAIKINEKAIEGNFLFIYPPAFEELRRRLGTRLETEEEFKLRIQNAIKEIEMANNSVLFTNRLVNDDLGSAIDQFYTLIEALYFQEIKNMADPVSQKSYFSALARGGLSAAVNFANQIGGSNGKKENVRKSSESKAKQQKQEISTTQPLNPGMKKRVRKNNIIEKENPYQEEGDRQRLLSLMDGNDLQPLEEEVSKEEDEESMMIQLENQHQLSQQQQNNLEQKSSFNSDHCNYQQRMEEGDINYEMQNDNSSVKIFDAQFYSTGTNSQQDQSKQQQSIKDSFKENINTQINDEINNNQKQKARLILQQMKQQQQQQVENQGALPFNLNFTKDIDSRINCNLIPPLKDQQNEDQPFQQIQNNMPLQNLPVEQRLIEYQKKTQLKLEYLKQQKEENEIKQLRHVPQISQKSNDIIMKKSMMANQSLSLSPKNNATSPIRVGQFSSNLKEYYEEQQRKEQARLRIVEEKELEGFTGKPEINKKSVSISRKVDDLLEWKEKQQKKRQDEVQKKLQTETQELENMKKIKVVNKYSEKLINHRYGSNGRSEKVQDRLIRDASNRNKRLQQSQAFDIPKQVSKYRSRSKSQKQRLDKHHQMTKSSEFTSIQKPKDQFQGQIGYHFQSASYYDSNDKLYMTLQPSNLSSQFQCIQHKELQNATGRIKSKESHQKSLNHTPIRKEQAFQQPITFATQSPIEQQRIPTINSYQNLFQDPTPSNKGQKNLFEFSPFIQQNANEQQQLHFQQQVQNSQFAPNNLSQYSPFSNFTNLDLQFGQTHTYNNTPTLEQQPNMQQQYTQSLMSQSLQEQQFQGLQSQQKSQAKQFSQKNAPKGSQQKHQQSIKSQKSQSSKAQPESQQSQKKKTFVYESLFNKLQKMNTSTHSLNSAEESSISKNSQQNSHNNSCSVQFASAQNQQLNPFINPIYQQIQMDKQRLDNQQLQQMYQHPFEAKSNSNSIEIPNQILYTNATSNNNLSIPQSNKQIFNYQQEQYINNFLPHQQQQPSTQDVIINKILDNSYIPSGNGKEMRKASNKDDDIFNYYIANVNQLYNNQNNVISNGNNNQNDNADQESNHESETNVIKNLNQVLSFQCSPLETQSPQKCTSSLSNYQQQQQQQLSPKSTRSPGSKCSNKTNSQNSTNFIERNSKWIEQKKTKLEKAKEILDQREERICTFKPQISNQTGLPLGPTTIQSSSQTRNKSKSNPNPVANFQKSSPRWFLAMGSTNNQTQNQENHKTGNDQGLAGKNNTYEVQNIKQISGIQNLLVLGQKNLNLGNQTDELKNSTSLNNDDTVGEGQSSTTTHKINQALQMMNFPPNKQVSSGHNISGEISDQCDISCLTPEGDKGIRKINEMIEQEDYSNFEASSFMSVGKEANDFNSRNQPQTQMIDKVKTFNIKGGMKF